MTRPAIVPSGANEQRRVTSAVAALAVLLVAQVVGAAPAPGQPYGPQPVSLSCAVTGSGANLRIGCSASGFASRTVLTVTLFSAPVELGRVETGANGSASIERPVPGGIAPGDHTVEATGIAADGRQATASTTVTIPGASGASAGTALPRTGSNTFPLAGAGSALVAVGGLLVLTARKRRTRRLTAAGA